MASQSEEKKVIPLIGAGYFSIMVKNYFDTRDKAFTLAKELSDSKGILNLGCGVNNYVTNSSEAFMLDPDIKANVDIAPDDGTIPDYYQIDLEAAQLPFENKQFAVSFASHCLEHIENWQNALMEWIRVADNTIIVLPHPWSIGQHFEPTHKRYVSTAWIEEVKQFPVEVFY
jgi:ubiquinone/menaquinone biosynthesis C-methylase UbiE